VTLFDSRLLSIMTPLNRKGAIFLQGPYMIITTEFLEVITVCISQNLHTATGM